MTRPVVGVGVGRQGAGRRCRSVEQAGWLALYHVDATHVLWTNPTDNDHYAKNTEREYVTLLQYRTAICRVCETSAGRQRGGCGAAATYTVAKWSAKLMVRNVSEVGALSAARWRTPRPAPAAAPPPRPACIHYRC